MLFFWYLLIVFLLFVPVDQWLYDYRKRKPRGDHGKEK